MLTLNPISKPLTLTISVTLNHIISPIRCDPVGAVDPIHFAVTIILLNNPVTLTIVVFIAGNWVRVSYETSLDFTRFIYSKMIMIICKGLNLKVH